jgi:hypothetical protein
LSFFSQFKYPATKDFISYLPDAWEVFYGLDKVDVGRGNVGASIQAGETVVILCK